VIVWSGIEWRKSIYTLLNQGSWRMSRLRLWTMVGRWPSNVVKIRESKKWPPVTWRLRRWSNGEDDDLMWFQKIGIFNDRWWKIDLRDIYLSWEWEWEESIVMALLICGVLSFESGVVVFWFISVWIWVLVVEFGMLPFGSVEFGSNTLNLG
jgi:hypothetical protein